MDLLEKLPLDAHEDNNTGVNWNDQHTGVQLRVSVVDAMAEVQCLDKPGWVKKCSHLADHFTSRIFQKFGENEELWLVFDRCDVPFSLKARVPDCYVLPHYPIDAHSASSDQKAPFTYQEKDGAGGLSGTEQY